MARKQFGRTICWILSRDENYDNVARLESLATRKQPPVVVIAHGEADTLIPTNMGRELAGIVSGDEVCARARGGAPTEVTAEVSKMW